MSWYKDAAGAPGAHDDMRSVSCLPGSHPKVMVSDRPNGIMVERSFTLRLDHWLRRYSHRLHIQSLANLTSRF